MRLVKLTLGAFRGRGDLVLEFGQTPRADPSLAFLVGPNGAGKSRLLEAIGRIFSHLSAGVSPGLDFDLEYELGERRVRIATRPPALAGDVPPPPPIGQVGAWLLIAEEPDVPWRAEHVQDRWPAGDLDRVLPFRVLGLSTGPTSRLDWALRSSLHETLAQQLEEVADGEEGPQSRLLRQAEVEERCIPLSGDELVLAVLALLGHPLSREGVDEVRDELLGRADLEVGSSLHAFSFVVSPDWQACLPPAQHQHFEQFLGQAERRVALDSATPGEETEVADSAQRAVFLLGPRLSAWIGRSADTPFVWFTHLLGWLKAGALASLRLVLSKRNHAGLLLDYDFSDGEFLFAGRYGLLQLLKEQTGCLVLFDEPETHFNDRWKVDLVFDLERVLAGCSAQVVLATHSDLTISDADRVDVHMLERPEEAGADAGETERPRQPPVSPLAADRDEITRQVFGAEAGSGRRGLEIVDRALLSKDPEQLQEALDRVGPGFHRFRLEYALRERDDDS